MATLRSHQAIGGIAVRECLAIRTLALERPRATLRKEYRVFIVDGAPAFWSFDYNFAELRVSRVPREAIVEAAALEPAALAEIRELAGRVGRALRVRFLVADFAVLDDGRAVLIETNPGHASGWCHPAAFVRAYAPFLRSLAGLPTLEPDAAERAAARAGIDLAGEGQLFGALTASS